MLVRTRRSGGHAGGEPVRPGVECDQDKVLEPRQGGERRREFRLVDQEPGRAVVHQHRQLRSNQAPVERLKDGADAAARQLQDQEVDAVARERRHPHTGRLAQDGLQPGPAAVDVIVQFAIGQPPA